MNSNLERYKKDLENLISKGFFLEMSMRKECNVESVDWEQYYEQIKKDGRKINEKYKNKGAFIKKCKEDLSAELLDFRGEYQIWYSESLTVIEQLIPNRRNDFIKLYERPKNRKKINAENYTIEDCVRGIYTPQVFPKAAIPDFQQQRAILTSAQKRFESSLFDITQLLQADLFDSELDAATELNKKGFIRGAGTITGVVLESHLKQVCSNHKIKISEKNPTINYLNDLLKKEGVIEISVWREIQQLADWRNNCTHSKKEEPRKEDITKLIKGVSEIIKTTS